MHFCQMGKGLQKIHYVVSEQGLTHYAGMALIHSFCKSLNLKRFIQRYIPLSHRNSYYHSLDTIRHKILMIPAKLVSHGHRHTLKLSAGMVNIDLFNLISKNITKVKPLI